MAQYVRDDRVVLWDRRRDIVYNDAGVREKWGVPPSGVADRLALVGDAADGFPGLPGWGDKSAAAVIARYGRLEDIPANASEWDVPVRGALALAATLREQFDQALLFRDLARLRTCADGVPIPQADAEELRWPGADRERWIAFCEEWGLPKLADRPPRWA
ncbi:MAG: 5'-3' exonuclease H3TH domain-containing protein [Chloroflexota bacterium]